MALTDSLISYWSLDEASGNALDAHGSNDLTDTNTVGSATGKISNARDFEANGTEYFTIASNASLQTGDIDFTISAWVKLESNVPWGNIVAKRGGVGSLEYWLRYMSSTARFEFVVSPDGSLPTIAAVANNLGAPSLATWYFIVAWHDATANTINIQVNNGTADSTSHTTGVYAGTAAFRIGNIGATPAELWDGLIDEVGFWKRVLTSDEKTSLYNSGSGLAYGDFGGGGGSANPWYYYAQAAVIAHG